MDLYQTLIDSALNGSGGGGGSDNLDGYFLKTIVNVKVPEGVVTLMTGCFKEYKNLESAKLPNTLERIPGSCFEGCNKLKEITIPASVKNIENRAFYGCSGLTSITSLATTPPGIGGASWHSSVPMTIPIYVPAESVDAYKSASYWSARADYIQAIS